MGILVVDGGKVVSGVEVVPELLTQGVMVSGTLNSVSSFSLF